MKRTFSAIAALAIGWGLCAPADATNPSATLSVQVVPAVNAGTCGAIMGQAAADAAAAGFNTCGLYNDFTTPIPNTVGTGLPSNWLNCHGDSVDTGSVWNVFGNVTVPCSSYSQVTDTGGGGNLALNMHYNASWLVPGSEWDNMNFMSTIPVGFDTSSNIPAHSWSNGYFEITERVIADTGHFPGEVQAFWAWGCCNNKYTFVEQDFFEDWASAGQHMDIAWDWWSGPPYTSGGFAFGTNYPDHTQSDYHTIGALITGNYSNFAVCNYFDGTRIGCYNVGYQSGQDGTQRRDIRVQNGAQCNSTYGNIACVGNSFNYVDMYIKNIKAIVCPAEPAGGSCLGNTYNGNFYQ